MGPAGIIVTAGLGLFLMIAYIKVYRPIFLAKWEWDGCGGCGTAGWHMSIGSFWSGICYTQCIRCGAIKAKT